MADQDNIQDELSGLNNGLPRPNSPTPFSVPEGYFDGLAASILARVKAQELSPAAELETLSPLVAGISRQMPYSLPAGYFDETISGLPFLMSEPTPAVLAAVGKTLPYTVPEGYFENLPAQVWQNVSSPKAKVVPLFARKWMRIAVAAVLGGVMLVGGYRLLNMQENDEVTAGNAKRTDTTEKLVASNNRLSVVQDIKRASTEELDAFIKSVPLNIDKPSNEPAEQEDQTEVNELLKDVSVKEMDNFLEQLPTADEDLATID